MKRYPGFTLIEVLLALAIVAIALTAVVKSTSNVIGGTTRITNKTIAHLVALQAVTMVQLKLLSVNYDIPVNQVTEMLGNKWYWDAKLIKTADPYVARIEIKVAPGISQPITEDLQAFLGVEP